MNVDNQSEGTYDPADFANEAVTPEEEAQDRADSEDLERCMKVGNGADPKFGSASALLMARGISAAVGEERTVLVDEKDDIFSITQRSSEHSPSIL